MKNRAGFFAGCADMLTWLCVYYAAAGILIMGMDDWGVHLGFILFWGVLCASVFAFLLAKPRGVPLLTAVTCALFAAAMGLFILVSKTPLKFGYGLVLAVGAGMASGMPLYYVMHCPPVHKHLTCLDVLILTLGGVLLCAEAVGVDTVTVAFMVIVLLLDAAAAVGLRMTEGGAEDSANALKASMVALGSAVIVFFLIAVLVSLLSGSGDVTGNVLHGIGSFFAAVGGGIERFFRWLSGLLYRPQSYDEILPEELSPSLANVQTAGDNAGVSVNTTAVVIVLLLLGVGAALCTALFLRRKRISRVPAVTAGRAQPVIRRRGGTLSALWQAFLHRIRFLRAVFIARNTPAGVLYALERTGKRKRMPRRDGETMRSFILRMDKTGGLTSLADALDREYYGGFGRGMEPRQCRTMRRYIRRL